MLTSYAAPENDNLRRLHTRNTTQQNAKPTVSLLQAGGTNLNRHTAGDFAHRGQQRERSIWRCDCLVGNGSRARLHQTLRLYWISSEVEVRKQHLPGTEHFAFVRLRLFDLDDQFALLENLGCRAGDDR